MTDTVLTDHTVRATAYEWIGKEGATSRKLIRHIEDLLAKHLLLPADRTIVLSDGDVESLHNAWMAKQGSTVSDLIRYTEKVILDRLLLDPE